MTRVRLVATLLALSLLGACGGRAGPGGGPDDGGTAADGPAPGCPMPPPDEGDSCAFDGTRTCDYPLPQPWCSAGADDSCRCLNGSWHCQTVYRDGGTCGLFDAGIDADLPAFCTGDSPHMIANGIESHPAVTGQVLPLNCCDAAEFEVVTATVPTSLVPIVVMWRAQVGAPPEIPATIDLAAQPEGWGVQVYVGCDPLQTGCNPAPDSYSTGLNGSLQVARTSAGGYDMSLCLWVAEPDGRPHPLLHSLELYAPHISASW